MQTKEVIQEILRAGTAIADIKNVEGTPTVIVPDGYKVHHMEALLPNPRRKRAALMLAAASSLIQYVNLHKGPGTIILADVGTAGATFKAILDHHSEKEANFGEHIATYQCKHSEEWTRWFAKDGVPMNQTAFAEFLEENKDSILKPDAAGLMELVQAIEGTKNVEFVEAKNLYNGSSQFTYNETVKLHGTAPEGKARKEMKLPTIIDCAIAPFENSNSRFTFQVRLKYRLEGPRLSFYLQAIDKSFIIDKAINSIIAEIKKETGIAVMLGSGK